MADAPDHRVGQHLGCIASCDARGPSDESMSSEGYVVHAHRPQRLGPISFETRIAEPAEPNPLQPERKHDSSKNVSGIQSRARSFPFARSTVVASIHTAFTERFGIRYPLVQAPMAGGPTTAQLVAAVSNAGALGGLGAAVLSPDAMRDQVAAVRALTHAPFLVNLFILDDIHADEATIQRAQERLAPLREELAIPTPPVPTRFAENNRAQIDTLIELAPPIASFTFGILSKDDVERFHAVGSQVVGTATTVAEAKAWEAVGADAICVQGIEAGGHRGTFLDPLEAADTGIMTLIPLVARAVSIPVIAAGGLMDGRAIGAALLLGAHAAQLGTAFLCCPESGCSELWKQTLRNAGPDSTELTRAFTGRYARALTNRFIRDFRPDADNIPAYPIQNILTRDIRTAAAAAGRTEFLSYWAGQGVGMIRSLPAGELVETLMTELRASLPPM